MVNQEYLIQATNKLYALTSLFPKKEPLRYKMRELADDILAEFIFLSKDKYNPKRSEKLRNFEIMVEILQAFLEVAGNQNRVDMRSIFELKGEYKKILNHTLSDDIKVSILIPCYNEEKSIRKCVQSCLDQTRKADEIVVVDDGSTDKTPEILESFGDKIKVKRIEKNSGNKSYAQEAGLRDLKGDIFIATDADTILDKNFVKRTVSNFSKEEVVAVSGYVKALKHNWLTTCRELDYIIGQNIHKVAQAYINALFVIPGCAGAFKTDFFRENIGFDHDTLTEDLDFTYKLHESGLKIKYDRSVIVYTQDPQDLKSYIKQMRRWYAGGWQNLMKHFKKIFNRAGNIFELSLIYIEGLIFSGLLFLIPLININVFNNYIFFYFSVLLGCAVYASLKNKNIDLLFCFPFYCLMIFLNAWIFLESFFNEVILKNKNMVWLSPARRTI
jgi:cellulose synthase/poly-beta-1,6-N-acetylglucosamine synthase-like glycosyltransferase